MTTRRLYVSRDASALALGVEATAHALREAALAAGVELEIRRVGTRGMTWLEPLVEIEDADGQRIGYGPVHARDVPGLVAHGLFEAAPQALCHGRVEDIPYFARQERLTFARVGVVDPASLDDYLAHGGYAGLRRALYASATEVVQEVVESGLRGRGGAAFPTGVKWRTVLEQDATQKYVVCNADEGDSGTFAERMLMEGDPFCLIEGTTIAGVAVGATRGYLYVRSEYPDAVRALQQALGAARQRGYLGLDVCGTGREFELELRVGAGAYICGEETSLLESLEGRRAEVRFRPPLPAVEGLFGRPTVINNGISLAAVPDILRHGAGWYRNFGIGRSRGTMPWQLAGNLRHGGLVEKAFGVTLGELLYDFGGGSLSGRPLRAVQVGGPLGAYLPESQFDTPLDYEAFAAIGAMVGHGGIVAFDDTVDMAHMARYALEFCAHESCGKCTPCRLGSTRGVEAMDRILRGQQRAANLARLESLCETMQHGSLCGLGGMTPNPVMSALRHFPGDFARDR